MFKSIVIVVLALAICIAADPIRQQKPLGRRVLARQLVQPTPAPTGYPAAGATPEIPFELPTETEKPDVVLPDIVTQQPDEVYGPPELQEQQPADPDVEAVQPDEVYGQPEAKVEQPVEVYGLPASETETVPAIVREITQESEEQAESLDEADEEVIIDEDGGVISISTSFEKPARLVYQRFPQNRQQSKPVPARLTKAKLVRPANFVYKIQDFESSN